MHVCPECGQILADGGFCPQDGAALASSEGDPLLGEMLGPYRLVHLVGLGGMGRVYKGVNPTIRSRVAIKVLSHDGVARPDLVERFFAEARAVNLIRHENIVNVLDLARLPDGRPYIVMEFLDGAPLSQLMALHGRLPLGTLANLVIEALTGLAAAHAKGVVHRDLKPDNVFVTRQGRAKVLDFGVAKLASAERDGMSPTRAGSLLGTPHYMSPEQALSREVDARADIYAVGVILYEGATGRKPFEGESVFEILRQQVEDEPPPPRRLAPEMPPAYERVILRAMAKQPGARWPSADELARALADAVEAMPPPAWSPIGDRTRPDSLGPPTPARTPGAPPAPSVQPGDSRRSRLPAIAGSLALLGAAVIAVVASRGGDGEDGAVVASSASRGGDGGDAAVVASAEREGPGSGAARAVLAADGRARGEDGAPAAVSGGDGRAPGEAAAPTDATSAAVGVSGGPQTESLPGKRRGEGDRSVAIAENSTGVAGGPDPIAPTEAPRDAARQPSKTAERKPAHDAARKPVDDAARRPAENAARQPTEKAAETADLASPAAGPGPSVAPDQLGAPRPGSTGKPAGGKRAVAASGGAGSAPLSAWDVSGYLPRALRRARAAFPDAALARIDADGVYPTGRADLTLDESFSVLYRFVSPSRGARPADLPMGAPHKPTCLYYVLVQRGEVSTYPLKGWSCDEHPPIRMPRCTAREIWRRAAARGAPTRNAVASLSYRATRGGEPEWWFDIGGEHQHRFPDDC